jgi:mono/diheme cytochrome c family protein
MKVSRSHPSGPKKLILTVAAGVGVVILGGGMFGVLKPQVMKHALAWATRGRWGSDAAARSGHSVDFARDIQPIFNQNCVKCHGPEKQKGGLRFDPGETAMKAGESGEMPIVPGDTARSALLRRVVSHDPDEEMPPKGDRLPPEKVALLERWISEGASSPWANGAPGAAPQTALADKTKHWAFQPLANVTVPQVQQSAWAITPIDAFILAAQETHGLHPNPEASRRVLIRRLYFDVLGLPPTPQEIAAFENDPSPSAYEHLVDQVLADPHYGERWGRHWLDAARYADSNGYEEDRPRPCAYTYRDFVIRAFDEDLPYDRFIQWQIAGDLLEPHNPEAIAATGFIAAAPNVRPEFINFRKKDRDDELDNIVSTTGSAILGLTIGCARCHDHKFDPIPTADYYRLTAFFASTERVERPQDEQQGREYDKAMAQFDESRLKKIKEEEKQWKNEKRKIATDSVIETLPISTEEKALLRAKADKKDSRQFELLNRFAEQLTISDLALRHGLSKEDQQKWVAFDKAEDDLSATRPAPIPRMLTIEEGPAQKSYVLLRGNPEAQGPEVKPGCLSLFTEQGSHWSLLQRFVPQRETRADLAHWLTDVNHGAGALTARVAVNRLWQHHFGRGIVDTPGDFGLRGDAPTNPQLLDWLATEFIREGWHMKPLHKMILMSAVYRQDDTSDDARVALDPSNRLLWRRKPHRIEAEVLRDSMLAVSGCLNPALYGPAVKPRINPEAISVTNREKHYDEWPANVTDGPATWRRSVYIFAKRSNLFPFLQVFDASDTIRSCPRRTPTTVAPQALTLLNDPFVREQARAFAARLAPLETPEARIRTAFELALGRPPSPEEAADSLRFLDQQAHDFEAPKDQTAASQNALTDFCQGLMALNEFAYID